MSDATPARRFTYDYERPALTADAVIVTRGEPREVLLIRRGRPPFEGRLALPGGFVEPEEPLEAAAARELEEETGLGGVTLAQLGAYGDPGRDPRGWTVSVAFVGEVGPEARGRVRGSDDASEARFFPLTGLERPLAFDHDRILEDALRWLDERRR